MRYAVRYSENAITTLRRLRPYDRGAILNSIDRILTINPTLVNKARIKRLRQPAPTQYRLRVGEFRILYDVEEQTVKVILILSKEEAQNQLEDI